MNKPSITKVIDNIKKPKITQINSVSKAKITRVENSPKK